MIVLHDYLITLSYSLSFIRNVGVGFYDIYRNGVDSVDRSCHLVPFKAASRRYSSESANQFICVPAAVCVRKTTNAAKQRTQPTQRSNARKSLLNYECVRKCLNSLSVLALAMAVQTSAAADCGDDCHNPVTTE